MTAKKAFTLLELMVIVAIVIILLSAVFVSLYQAKNKSKVAAYKSQIQSIYAAAVATCDTAVLSGSNVTKPSGPNHIGDITVLPEPLQSCGVASLGKFIIRTEATNVGISACEVPDSTTITEKGVIFPEGC